MIDLTPLTDLLVPLLEKARDGGLEALGGAAVGALLTKLKNRLAGTPAQEALDDLAQNPTDADQQATLRTALKKSITAQPELDQALAEWLAEARAAQPGIQQNANFSGNYNTVIQIAGAGNNVVR